MAVSAPRCLSDDGHDHPLRSVLAVAQIQQKEVVARKTAAFAKKKLKFISKKKKEYLPPVAPP